MKKTLNTRLTLHLKSQVSLNRIKMQDQIIINKIINLLGHQTKEKKLESIQMTPMLLLNKEIKVAQKNKMIMIAKIQIDPHQNIVFNQAFIKISLIVVVKVLILKLETYIIKQSFHQFKVGSLSC